MSVQVAPPSLVEKSVVSLVSTHPSLGVMKVIRMIPDASGDDIVVSVTLAPWSSFFSCGRPNPALPNQGALAVIQVEPTTVETTVAPVEAWPNPIAILSAFHVIPPSSVANSTTTPG